MTTVEIRGYAYHERGNTQVVMVRGPDVKTKDYRKKCRPDFTIEGELIPEGTLRVTIEALPNDAQFVSFEDIARRWAGARDAAEPRRV